VLEIKFSIKFQMQMQKTKFILSVVILIQMGVKIVFNGNRSICSQHLKFGG